MTSCSPLQGAAGMLWHDDAADDGFWQDTFLFQWSSRIGGGTEQVQRNIIAERVLGPPPGPRPQPPRAVACVTRGVTGEMRAG